MDEQRRRELRERLEAAIAEAGDYYIADDRPETRQCALVEIGDARALLALLDASAGTAWMDAADRMANTVRSYHPGDDWCPSLRDALDRYDAARSAPAPDVVRVEREFVERLD